MASRGWRILKDSIAHKQAELNLVRRGKLFAPLPGAIGNTQCAPHGTPSLTQPLRMLAGFSREFVEFRRREGLENSLQVAAAERRGFVHTLGVLGCHVSRTAFRAVQGSATAEQTIPPAEHETLRHYTGGGRDEGESSRKSSSHECWSCGAPSADHHHHHRLSNPKAHAATADDCMPSQSYAHLDQQDITEATANPSDTTGGEGSGSSNGSRSARLPPAVRDRFFCSSCGALQPADSSLSYFDIFGLPEDFTLPLDLLESRYKDLQRLLHPDLHAGRQQEEQRISAELSSLVINAYFTLLRPLARAKYMLRFLLGADDQVVEGDSPGTDQALLMEVMEIREAIDDAGTADELLSIKEMNGFEMQAACHDFASASRAGDKSNSLSAMHRMAYRQRIANEIEEKLHRI